MYVAHAGMATKGEARDDKPGCRCEYGSSVMSTSPANSDSLQCTCNEKLCFNTINVKKIAFGNKENTTD